MQRRETTFPEVQEPLQKKFKKINKDLRYSVKERMSKVHPPATFYPLQLPALPSASSFCRGFPPFLTLSSKHQASPMPWFTKTVPWEAADIKKGL